MSNSDLTAEDGYQSLLGKISQVYASGRALAAQAVNTHITETYWQIGRDIVEFEQGGSIRAEYGKRLVASLAKDLSLRHGKGFSRSNVMMMKAFYLAFPKVQTLSGQLSWSHSVELLSISDDLERAFYEKQAIAEKWSVKELQRQKKTSNEQPVLRSEIPTLPVRTRGTPPGTGTHPETRRREYQSWKRLTAMPTLSFSTDHSAFWNCFGFVA